MEQTTFLVRMKNGYKPEGGKMEKLKLNINPLAWGSFLLLTGLFIFLGITGIVRFLGILLLILAVLYFVRFYNLNFSNSNRNYKSRARELFLKNLNSR